MGNLTIDPEFEALIPPLALAEFEALKQSILRDGCRDALVVWNGILVDGHNRHKICTQNRKPFRTTKLEHIDSREQVLEWIIDNQLARRNVNDVQRAELALKKGEIIAARAKEKMEAGTNQHSSPKTNLSKGAPINTRREIAKAAGVSEGTVAKVKKIQAQAVPEVIEAARAGEIKADVAAAVATLPKEDQVALAAKGKSAMKAAAKQMREAKKKKCTTPLPACQPTKPVSTRVLPTSAPSTADGDDEPARLRAENAMLQTRFAELTDMLKRAAADFSTIDEILHGDEPIAAALAEVKRLTRFFRELESRLAGLQAEDDTLARQDVVQRDEDNPKPKQEQALPDAGEAVCNEQPDDPKAVDPAKAAREQPVAQLNAGPA